MCVEILLLVAFSGVCGGGWVGGWGGAFFLRMSCCFFVLSAGLCFDLVLLGFWRVSKNGILVLLGMF